MKKYEYNGWLIFLTIILFPIIYWKSKKTFKAYKDFCHNYQTEGKDNKTGVEFNTFDSYKANLRAMRLPETTLKTEDIIEYKIRTKKGDVSVVKILNANSKKWVIGLHGWTENKYLGLRLVEHFYHAGYNVITFDAYAHGQTYGSKTDLGLSTITILDSLITHLLNQKEVQSLGLIGNSMGAATAVLYSQIGKHKHKLNWVIEDCGFSDLKRLYRYYLENNFTHEKWWLISYNINKNFTKETNVDHDKYDLISMMDKNTTTPILFIHSQGDRWIPVSMGQEMFEQKMLYEPVKKSVGWFPIGSSHVHTISDYHQDYLEKTLEFASQNEI